MSTISNRMKDTRIDLDLTQETIAKHLGITKQQYQLYESGKRRIHADTLQKFCTYTGVSADYLMDLPPSCKKPR